MLAGWRMLPIGTTYGGFYFAIAADALIFGALWAAYMVIGRSISEQNLGVGALVVLTVMIVAASIAIPSGAHPRWPLLFAMLAISMSLGVTDERLTTRGAILGVHCARARHSHVRAIVGLRARTERCFASCTVD